MKVRVSGLVWVPKAELGSSLAQLKKTLTIVPRKSAYDDEPPTPVPCWAETLDEFGLPRDYFFASAKQKHDVTWEVSDGEPICLRSNLRQTGDYAEQAAALDTLEGWLRGFDTANDPIDAGLHLGCILQADPGFGKTASALELARRLGRTTLIIVHKEFLLTQWQRRIEAFLPDAKVGIVREDVCDFEGKDIVLAMVQSLALEGSDGKQRYPLALYRYFGLIVIDEVHRIGALTWSQVPKMFSAKWRIGLSATPRRRDGTDKVFWWNIGQIRYAAKTKRPVLSVRMVKASVSGPDILRRDVSPSIIVNILAKLTGRNHIIVQEIVGALMSSSGRKIMVLSERLEHLRDLDSMLRREVERLGIGDVSTGFYVGEWFTGERSEKLAKGYWNMDGGGRKRAEAAIYTSLSRRKLAPGETRAVDKEDDGTKVIIFGGGRVPLSELTELELYSIARSYDIKQAVTEKKRRRTEEELAEAERARVIWATYQMTSEGIDIPAVDTIGFATPVSDVEQSYGRGRRVCAPVAHGGDKTPETCVRLCSWRAGVCTRKPAGMAFDVVDVQVPLAVRRSQYRLSFYAGVGARVVDIDTRK